MARRERLLEIKGNKGLYVHSDPATGTWQEWRTLPALPAGDPAERLLAEAGPTMPHLPGGLYGDPERARADQRRRAADKVLQDHGLRGPRPW